MTSDCDVDGEATVFQTPLPQSPSGFGRLLKLEACGLYFPNYNHCVVPH